MFAPASPSTRKVRDFAGFLYWIPTSVLKSPLPGSILWPVFREKEEERRMREKSRLGPSLLKKSSYEIVEKVKSRAFDAKAVFLC